MSGNNVSDAVVPGSIEADLGYDPWDFPKLINPVRDISYVVFGWCIYEALECATTLLSAREERRSRVYQGLVVAFIFQLAATALGMVDAGSPNQVVTDFFRGPDEFAISTICFTCLMVARWAYFYVSVKITLDATPANRQTFIRLCTATVVAVVGSLCYTCITEHFFRLTYDQYGDYMEANNVDVVMRRISEDIKPFEKTVTIGQIMQAVTMVHFSLVTKMAILWGRFKDMDVPFYEAVKTLAKETSVQRLVSSSIWTIVDAGIMLGSPENEITGAMRSFSLMFEINTLSMLAFVGPAAIVKEIKSRSSNQMSSQAPHSSIRV